MGIQDLTFDDLPDAGQPKRVSAANLNFDDLPNAKQSMGDQVLRQLGLTARAGMDAVGVIPHMFADPLVRGANSLFGSQLPIPSEAYQRTLDQAYPTPRNNAERFANKVAGGMVQPALVGSAAPQFAAQIGTQILSGGAGAGGSDIARQLGLGPFGQTVAGIVSGVAAPTVVAAGITGAKAAGRGLASLAAPFTQEGRKNVAAGILQRSANYPANAADNIANAPQYVPGVNPTTAELANDAGVSSIYKSIRNQNPAAFSDVEGANDAARQAYLLNKFGTPADTITAQAARDATTGPMREAAFANAGAVDTAPIVKTGNQLLEAGAKYRGPLGTMLRNFVGDIAEISDPQVLYNGPRKAINDAIAGKMSQDSPLAQFTKSELLVLRKGIDAQIEQVAPGFTNYLKTHADLSRSIDAKQLGQDIAQRATNPLTERLSPAQMARQVSSNGPDIAAAGPRTSDALYRVNEDLKRSVAPMNAMRTAGSDTLQNMVGNDMLQRSLGRLPGGVTTRVASKLLSMLYSPAEQQTRGLLVQSMIDPKIGEELLRRKLRENPDLLAGLLNLRGPIAQGGLLGTISAQ